MGIYTKKRIISDKMELLKQSGQTKCTSCGQEGVDKLTVDHIIPQWILKDMGFSLEEQFEEENLRVMCRMCNSMKGGRLDFTYPKTKELLLKYLDKI